LDQQEPPQPEEADQEPPRENQGHNRSKKDGPKESKVHRFSQGERLYNPKPRQRKTPAPLTADQYLRRAGQDGAVSGLIRSLHKTDIMSFEDWERETSELLKKRTQ
jgi:hypothetical protein